MRPVTVGAIFLKFRGEMAHFWQCLRTGNWLTAARARGYGQVLLVICTMAFSGWIAISDGLIDRNGKSLGTDFSNVYAAGVLTWQGRPADAYEPARQHVAEKAIFGGREVPFYGWHYPPFFFVVAFLVAAVPYACGLALWLVASFAAYLATLRAAPVGKKSSRCFRQYGTGAAIWQPLTPRKARWRCCSPQASPGCGTVTPPSN